MRRTAVLNHATDENQRLAAGAPAAGAPHERRRRTMGLCAHCHRPVEFDQEHLRLHRLFWHMECALAGHEPATD